MSSWPLLAAAPSRPWRAWRPGAGRLGTDTAELAARRLEAYANLLVAAGEVLGTYRRNLDALSPDFGQKDADKANAHMADLAAALHRASAVVALTGSDLGRRQGKDLYETARGVAAI